ncbi:phosphoglucomutase (alpha-D-glucose-1,6-bisphosphate-dependent) [Pelomonas cellulosilytica]|uniref:Phosphoglucomutase n=1 Tax=Pelomonas cellulosilytica TaxID=2906762 RepID=A0ABS8XN84_9BURK|nr:phosphoglucomutase (alpha-D-glucose-1,6-bisphosphate-dependent) [Pelomonas sp. P8]MCE4554222.1 phosphoglucomutase (alpha-D-glucose-1,6-bisphosphate-dependent) [Pelomonas sp. P8]
MSSRLHPLAGKPAPADALLDLAALNEAYYARRPDPANADQRVAFGTSGHRGSALDGSFNEWHVLAITQAIVDHRKQQGIAGPLFVGADTHALSAPAVTSALEVLAANGVDVMLAPAGQFTPTPAVSLAILEYNVGKTGSARADGIVVTPSHNPPRDGGFKYNPPNGGPADTDITSGIQKDANAYLERQLQGVHRLDIERAKAASTTHVHDYLAQYVAALEHVIDFDVIRASGIRLGVDPLGGAGVAYWPAIAERYQLPLTVVSDVVDGRFPFMTLDWDGKIRMDPSSPYAMQRLTQLGDKFDVAFACDTDHDRHGIVTPTGGLMQPNNYLSVVADYLFRQRPGWASGRGMGKTVVTTALIERIAKGLGVPLFDTPVGFKWFAPGLQDGTLGLGCEESAGASFLRRDGRVWTTDKDGIAAALLAGEITARTGSDPSVYFNQLTATYGRPHSDRIDSAATREQKARLSKLSPADVTATSLAGEPITAILTQAPANGAAIGGVKVTTANGWFAARPSGTEDIYKVYAESFNDEAHLQRLLQEAQDIVNTALKA